jgi:16S rRNA (guanine966-N2)-methyltransferase
VSGLRIIGGEWRGRRLDFPAGRDLRPTGDRLRETLFNWLREDVPGARVLDLFAGSGALGLEALSRGASEAVFVERSRPVAQALRANLERLDAADRARVVSADARRFLAGSPTPFDLIFLDPPFRSAMIGPVCAALAAGGWLSERAIAYLEFDRHGEAPPLPASWSPVREKSTGAVSCRLVRCHQAGS